MVVLNGRRPPKRRQGCSTRPMGDGLISDVLSVLRGEQVTLETSSPSGPGVLRPVGADNYIHVVMPMFVQW